MVVAYPGEEQVSRGASVVETTKTPPLFHHHHPTTTPPMISSSSASAPALPTPTAPHPLPPPSSLVTTITPAALSSLAIYNPSLGPTDETVHDQIVFYTSRKGNAVTSNDKLRQIGLAQGIVEFARYVSYVSEAPTWLTRTKRLFKE